VKRTRQLPRRILEIRADFRIVLLERVAAEKSGAEAIMSLKIMVVDDEPKSAQLMRALATPMGHMVIPFGDYTKAAQIGETQRFDVAFVGMRPPELTALELARRIRNSPKNREAAIVMMSDTEDVASLRKAFGEGADLVLTKPIASDHLKRMLAAIDLPEWKGRRHAVRLPLFAEVKCVWNGQESALRSMNISESGMLLQPAIHAEVGTEVGLEFRIEEVRAGLSVVARVVRKEGDQRVAVQFVDLEPEDRNAIQVYVTGRLKGPTASRDLSDVSPKRMFRHR
jgi:CheY-like chemotaxis protein